LMDAGLLEEAASCLGQVAALDPESFQAHLNLGTVLQKQGKDAAALSEYDRAAGLDPNSFQVWNNLAWLLSNTRQPSLHDGPKAVEFALRADQLSGGSNVTVLINLAAAYAGVADYPQAAAASRRAAVAASVQGDNILAGQLRKQAELYETSRPAE
jgi:tetratricopeptide (TPR) repeat protein